MKQTLKQRIIPEVDERELDRESEKVSSYVEESLKDLAPGLDDGEIFGTDSLFDDLEDMQDMTDDFFGDDPFSLDGADGFAGDVAFGEGPAEMSGDGMDGAIDELSNFASQRGSNRRRDGTVDKLTDMGDILQENKELTGKTAAATATLGKLFAAGGAAVLLGGFGLAILSSIWSTVKRMSQHSPLLETVVSLLGMAIGFFLRPFAHWIGQLLLPIMMDLLALSAEFMSISFEEGIWEGVKFLASTLFDALFSLPGLIALSITGIGAILGALLGKAVAVKLGAVLGGLLGSLFGPVGTVVGAAIGATIGGTLFAILGVLAAYNIDGIIDALRGIGSFFGNLLEPVADFLGGIFHYLSDVASSLSLIQFIAFAILGPFGLLAIEFYEWMSDRFGDFMEWIDGLGDSSLGEALGDMLEMPDFGIWEWVKEKWPGWPDGIPNFGVWEWIKDAWDGWPSEVFSFGVWDAIQDAWDGWPSEVFSFDVWDAIQDAWEGWPSEVFSFDVWDDISDAFEGWPRAIWEFSIWSDVYDAFQRDGWPAAIWEFSIWSDIYRLFTGEGGWPQRIWEFTIWSDIWNAWPGWPGGISSFNVWSRIESWFPGWPSLSFPGWDTFVGEVDLSAPSFNVDWDRYIDPIDWNLSGFDWGGDFIPSISWSIPSFPGWHDVVTKASDAVSSAFDSFTSNTGSGSSPTTGGGGSSGGSGYTPPTQYGSGGSSGGGGSRGGGSGGSDWSPPEHGSGSTGGPRSGGNSHLDGLTEGRTGLAEGGIVTDTLMTFVGEGRESEVVTPLSKLDNMIESREGVSVDMSVSNVSENITEREVRNAVARGMETANANSDDEVVRQLQNVVREINRLGSNMDLSVEFDDTSKWEVRK